MANENEISEGIILNSENLDDVIEDLVNEESSSVINQTILSTTTPTQQIIGNTRTQKPIEITETNKLILPEKKDVLKEDPLIKGILNDEGVFDLLDIVLAELAEESASLKYERIKKELENKDTDRLSLRRANILKMISDALVQKRNLALNDFINLRSPQWQLVFDLLMKKVRQTFVDLSYSSEQLELFFQKLQGNLEGFEENTEIKLKESLSRTD